MIRLLIFYLNEIKRLSVCKKLYKEIAESEINHLRILRGSPGNVDIKGMSWRVHVPPPASLLLIGFQLQASAAA